MNFFVTESTFCCSGGFAVMGDGFLNRHGGDQCGDRH